MTQEEFINALKVFNHKVEVQKHRRGSKELRMLRKAHHPSGFRKSEDRKEAEA